ncbi:MAG: nicotinate phosphoribosyltransferase, partial [Pirellulaceae bacterium]|nr:nicotinate phosphoribosyltransferase [Pirellulaceae bacterium]
NAVGFQTLVATKAARICQAAGDRPVLEFGLRRAQGPDGAMAASRAAYVGGCAGTSNVLAGKTFGIPVKGTQAHSWVMAFESELDAFKAFARAAPNNCIFLVDTYDSLAGTRHAVEAAAELAGSDNRLLGIRLDSGDLVRLSIEARRILNASGHQRATIVGSGDLDERAIEQLDAQGASIDVFGVGTRLVTAQDDPALTVVYKLSAMRGDDGRWEPRVKLSEEAAKSTVPGVLQVRRFSREWQFMADAVYDEQIGIECPSRVVDPADPSRSKNMLAHWVGEDLLVPVFDGGEPVGPRRSIEAARERCRCQLERLHPVVKRLTDPQPYAVGIEERLHALRMSLATTRMRRGGDATEETPGQAERSEETGSR